VTDIVTYIRVSTAQQGKSGLGLAAQRSALAQLAKTEGLELAREFVEVESGKGAMRSNGAHSSRQPWQQRRN
jgi:DNA invertase Pin-like site-specific DNA recombinase